MHRPVQNEGSCGQGAEPKRPLAQVLRPERSWLPKAPAAAACLKVDQRAQQPEAQQAAALGGNTAVECAKHTEPFFGLACSVYRGGKMRCQVQWPRDGRMSRE